MEVGVPGLEVELERQLQAYATTTATWDLSHLCDLHCSLWQRQILNPLGEARHGTCNLMVPSQIHFRCTTVGTLDTSQILFLQVVTGTP